MREPCSDRPAPGADEVESEGETVERASRTVEREGRAYVALEAWRGGSGEGLCYFVQLDGPGGEPVEEDDGDLRAPLGPDEDLRVLSEDRLAELLEGATPLTVTERRFRAPDGRLWLAQSVGPVWAEDGVAEGITGVKFTSLQGPLDRVEAAGGHVGRMGRGALVAAWRRARDAGAPTEETSRSET